MPCRAEILYLNIDTIHCAKTITERVFFLSPAEQHPIRILNATFCSKTRAIITCSKTLILTLLVAADEPCKQAR